MQAGRARCGSQPQAGCDATATEQHCTERQRRPHGRLAWCAAATSKVANQQPLLHLLRHHSPQSRSKSSSASSTGASASMPSALFSTGPWSVSLRAAYRILWHHESMRSGGAAGVKARKGRLSAGLSRHESQFSVGDEMQGGRDPKKPARLPPNKPSAPAHHIGQRQRAEAAAVNHVRRFQLLVVGQHPAVALQVG